MSAPNTRPSTVRLYRQSGKWVREGVGGTQGDIDMGPIMENMTEPDLNTIPPPVIGVTEPLIGPGSAPEPAGDGVGAQRTVVGITGFRFDDPLVNPNQPNGTHLHMYFGNDAFDHELFPSVIRTRGGSTARGGTVNNSSYWVPAIIDAEDGAVMKSGNQLGDPSSFYPLGAVQVYYKTNYEIGNGSNPPESRNNHLIQPFPPQFAMIVGDPMRTPTSASPPSRDAKNVGKSNYRVLVADPTSPHNAGDELDYIPLLGPGGSFRMNIVFPQAWNGVDLFKADLSHTQHIRRSDGWPEGAPESHPTALPALEYQIAFRVPEGRTTARWRLSSDMYPESEGPGGYSLHADFINGWDQEIHERAITQIVQQGKTGGSSRVGQNPETGVFERILDPENGFVQSGS